MKYAYKKLNKDGAWIIYFNPKKKLDGEYYYSQVTGFIDEQEADKFVKFLIKDSQGEASSNK